MPKGRTKIKVKQKLILAILSIAIVVLFLSVAIGWLALMQKQGDTAVRLAERQLMLVHKITKEALAYQLQKSKSGLTNPMLSKQIKMSMAVFDKTHAALKDSGEAPLSMNIEASTENVILSKAEEPIFSRLQKVSERWSAFNKKIHSSRIFTL